MREHGPQPRKSLFSGEEMLKSAKRPGFPVEIPTRRAAGF